MSSALNAMLSNSSMRNWMDVYLQIGERELDMAALKECVQLSLNPLLAIMQKKLIERQVHNDDTSRKNQLTEMEPCDLASSYEPKPYVFERDSEEDEEQKDDDDNKTPEYTYRHPGSVVGPGQDERWANVCTKVSRYLFAVDFVGPNAECSLHPVYSHQVSVRLDEQDDCLYYDCFSYVPKTINVEEELPTNRWITEFEKIRNPPELNRRSLYDDDSDDEEETDDDTLDQPVVMRQDTPENRKDIHMQAIFGKFLNSKCFRIKLPLDSVCGMTLQVNMSSSGPDDYHSGVLVLELTQPVDDFVARLVGSRFASANKFHKMEQDWTPRQAASRATRHYIYGAIGELKDLVAHICHINPRLKAMMTTTTRLSKKRKTSSEGAVADATTNSLSNASLSYSAAPNVASSDATTKNDEGDSKPAKLTTDMVNNLFIQHGLATEGSIRDVNQCLRAAVLKGHQVITEETTKETVLYEGPCHNCRETIAITWGQAMDQRTYAGLDYEDGGENAEVHCDGCGGNYLTGLCEATPHFDCGKFHNHCTECRDFGVCIYDYRNAHCHNCGCHYFQGLSGFSCQECGGGRSNQLLQERLAELPDESTWDGEIRGLEVAIERVANDSGSFLPMLQMLFAQMEQET